MTAPLLRPTFRIRIALPREEAAVEIRRRLIARQDLAGRWMSKGRWVDLFVPPRQRRIWSPYLSGRLDDCERGECTVLGRFAPHPEVWTFFMFLYFLVAFLILFGATLGYVQWASNEAAWGLWSVWIGAPVLALIHVASAVGARLGQEQMRGLRRELDELLAGAPRLGAVPD